MRFEGQTAFITGAGHGIGHACAMRLGAEGAAVVVTDVDEEAAIATARDVTESGSRAIPIGCDVTRDRSVKEAVTNATAIFGGIDVLINNAGGDAAPDDADNPDDDHWARMLDFNLLGVVRCIRATLPHLLGAPRASVVTVGSINGLVAARSEPYSAAKAALQNLTVNLATRYGRHGIRFNLIAPGTIRTRVWDDQPEILDHLTSMYPLGRAGTPEDVAAAVAFLASDEAAWITGITMPVDGGLLAAGPIRW